MLGSTGSGRGAAQVVLLLVLVSQLVLQQADAFNPRRIMFAKCDATEESSVKPKSLFMTCANSRGVCEVRAGTTHTLRAVFIPTINSTDVDSSASWNSWFEVPLPGQNRDACDGPLSCPVRANVVTRFTYNLEIQNFWPREEYPVIWKLTDRDTNSEITCFKFKINIV